MSTSFFMMYWWLWILPFIIAQQNQARKRRQMGPRICVEPNEFLRLVGEEKGLVIRGRKFVLQGTMYLSRCGDYYYYTHARAPLHLPRECEVRQARQILL